MTTVREPVKDLESHSRELFSCEMQGELFAEIFDMGYSNEDFIKKFMNSEICAGMDMEFSRHQTDDPKYTLSCLLDTIVPEQKGRTEPLFYCWSDAWNIGFMYRYIQCRTGLSSSFIYEKIPFQNMCRLCGNADCEEPEYYMDVIEEEGLLK